MLERFKAHIYSWCVKKFAFGLLILLYLSVLPALAASPIKPGISCTKLGQKRESGDKEFTCIKSGKKKVWSKGVVKKSGAASSSNSVPKSTNGSASETMHILGKDLRITPAAKLSKVEICKTTDQTPGGMSNGFPRPKELYRPAQDAKVLLIPLSFTDRPFRVTPINSNMVNSDLDLAKLALKYIEERFEELSAGRFRVKVELLPQDQWWNLDFPDSLRGGWGAWENMDELVRISNEKKPQFQFNDYDAYMFIASNYVGAYNAQANFKIAVKNSKTGFANIALMSGGLTQSSLYVHELFHSLFGLEDLYLSPDFGGPSVTISDYGTPAIWDIMSDNIPSLLNWSRFLMGWLRDTEVRCISDQSASTHYLTSFGNSAEPKLTLINLADGVTLAAEVRDNGNEKGLLIYTIDTYIQAGQGPIKTFNKLLSKGMKRSIYGWDISVLDADKDGVLFDVAKTDVDKYVAPTRKDTNVGSRPESPIPLTGGDLIRKSNSTAEISWNPSKYESYRIFVTGISDFQKVYFETGIVDSNANPLVVEIKGLVCGVDLRVMTYFFTKKGGQGESRTEEKILGRSQC